MRRARGKETEGATTGGAAGGKGKEGISAALRLSFKNYVFIGSEAFWQHSIGRPLEERRGPGAQTKNMSKGC